MLDTGSVAMTSIQLPAPCSRRQPVTLTMSTLPGAAAAAGGDPPRCAPAFTGPAAARSPIDTVAHSTGMMRPRKRVLVVMAGMIPERDPAPPRKCRHGSSHERAAGGLATRGTCARPRAHAGVDRVH